LTFKQLRVLIAIVLENPRRPVAARSTMPEGGEVATATARLEAALERIARGTADRPADEVARDPRLAKVAARLDALIASLRSALGEAG
jgi:hypothetical protein